MKDKKILLDFLHNELPTYYNPMGVQLYLNTDSTVIICSNFPGIEMPYNITLELLEEVKSINKLLSLLEISTLDQLFELTPSHLLELFARGHMSVICMIEESEEQEISFRKRKDDIWARPGNKGAQKIEIQFDRAEDYIDYTLKYFNIARVKNTTSPTAPNNPNK